MRQWARLRYILLATVTLAIPSPAQLSEKSESQPQQANGEVESPSQRQAALAMLDQVLAGVKSLSLPQNRIAIESEAFPIVWSRNEAQARALVNQMVAEFAQAAGEQNETANLHLRQMLRPQWQNVVVAIAQADPELARNFLTASRAYVRTGTPEQEDAEERQLRLTIASQEATRNPRKALQTAQKELERTGDLSPELINLLSQVEANDTSAGVQLLHDIVARVKNSDLSSGEGNFGFAVSLLSVEFSRDRNQTPGAKDRNTLDDLLRTLADALASAALSPQFPAETLPNLQGSEEAFEQFAPGKVQALRRKLDDYTRSLPPAQRVVDDFNQAQPGANPDQLLALAAQAPADVRPNLYQQVALKVAGDGDYQRARQIADHLSDPVQRAQILQQALLQATWSASNQGQFAAARQLAEQIMPDEDRAATLAQLGLNAANAKQGELAQQILDEAGSLLANRPQDSAAFSAQLQVAQAFVHLKSARAMPLLERSASQLEEVLAAAVQVDGFLPYQRSFEGGELILNSGFFFNSLIQPYVQATAELANYNLPAARILADRLPLPEARLMAELFVARSALGEHATVARFSNFRDLVVLE